jgi:hypothetical protein
MNKKRPTSDFLLARPSALFGQARFFDFGGSFDEYNSSDSPDEADAMAMYADWAAVGDTIESVASGQQDVPRSDAEEEAA